MRARGLLRYFPAAFIYSQIFAFRELNLPPSMSTLSSLACPRCKSLFAVSFVLLSLKPESSDLDPGELLGLLVAYLLF